MDERLWSATALSDAGYPKGNALVNWAANETAAYAVDNLEILSKLVENGDRDGALDLVKGARYRRQKAAMFRGSELHRYAEALAYGEPIPHDVDPRIEPYAIQYRRFLEDYRPEFLLAEAPVYNRTRHYAGTTDGVILVDGVRLIYDVKSTPKGPTENRPPFPENVLQLIGYRRCEFVGLRPASMREYAGRRYYVWDPDADYAPMPEVDGAAVLVVSPFDYDLVAVRSDDDVWAAFLHVFEVARFVLDTSRTVVGPSIPRPPAVSSVADVDAGDDDPDPDHPAELELEAREELVEEADNAPA